MADVSRVLSAEQAAALVGVSPKTVRRWILSGRLKADKRGRSFRISHDALGPFMGQETPPISDTAQQETGTADSGRYRSGQRTADTALVELVRDLKAELVAKAEAAAMWQARAEFLAGEVRQLQAALEAPKAEPVDPVSSPRPSRPRQRPLRTPGGAGCGVG
jgi:excisionase family DNA binding protein